MWWEALCRSVREAERRLPERSEPLGIGVTGQMHGLVALGSRSDVVRPAIIWCDQRSAEEAQTVAALTGPETLLRVTRARPVAHDQPGQDLARCAQQFSGDTRGFLIAGGGSTEC